MTIATPAALRGRSTLTPMRCGWCLTTGPTGCSISDTDFDRHHNQVLTCDVISTDPDGPPLTVRLADSDPVAGW